MVHYTFSTGDPALDYIGTGGAAYLPEDSVIPGKSWQCKIKCSQFEMRYM